MTCKLLVSLGNKIQNFGLITLRQKNLGPRPWEIQLTHFLETKSRNKIGQLALHPEVQIEPFNIDKNTSWEDGVVGNISPTPNIQTNLSNFTYDIECRDIVVSALNANIFEFRNSLCSMISEQTSKFYVLANNLFRKYKQ